MTDVLSVFRALRDYYVSYYETPFELRDLGLSAERRQLLLQEGEIFREPLLEVSPGFASSGLTVRQAGDELGLTQEFADFVERGLFPSDLKLFTHQWSTLQAATAGKNFVVTAGTGSGKTEAFLLPVIHRLVEESSSWPAPNAAPSSWWRTGDPWVAQRVGETRDAAIRCIILYPMNALVEDQLRRLRVGLDSEGSRRWLDERRHGNLFYFGRYTGRTPVAGEIGRPGPLNDLREKLRKAEAISEKIKGDDRRYFFARLDGAEMRSRWDMIDRPPDILITNYSMLNVMLMRSREDRMFDLTADWLAADRAGRSITLVVDELHMYRGTPGSEVAFLLRNLRKRLGLDTSQGREQMVIHAASASLAAEKNGLDYVRQFFADPRFEQQDFHSGQPADPPPPPSSRVNAFMDVFRAYPSRSAVAETEAERRVLVDELAADLGVDRPSLSTGSDTALSEVVDTARLPGALVAAFGTDDRRPLKLSDLADRLFSGIAAAADEETRAEALAGLVQLIADAGVLPVRTHLFFRNIRGAWACSDPDCASIRDEWRSAERRVGKLFLQPQLQCGPECGSRVLELLYCEICGEAFLGGYGSGGDGVLYQYLLPDVPNLESLPDLAATGRTNDRYLVYWPSTDAPSDPDWTLQGTKFQWRRAAYRPKTGRIDRKAIGATGWVFTIDSPDPEALPALPSRCPRCGEVSERRDPQYGPRLTLPEKLRPLVRTMGTGFEKVSQVLADAVLRQVKAAEGKRKLVVFSDSRQDAAKLSTGLETTHYQDLVRQLISQQLEKIGANLAAFLDFVDNGTRSEKATAYAETHPDETAAVLMEKASAASEAQKASAAKLRSQVAGPWSIRAIGAEAERALLALGVNPAGPAYDLQKFGAGNSARSWAEIFNFSVDPPTARPMQDLSLEAERLLQGIRRQLRDQFQFTLFAGRGRDLESLGIGWATFDPTVEISALTSLPKDLVADAAEGAIRILGSRYRVDNGEKDGVQNMPAYLRRYVEEVARRNGLPTPELIDAVERLLIDSKAMIAGYLLNLDQLYVRSAAGAEWECSTCRRLHLHQRGGVCTNSMPRATHATADSG